MDQQQQSTDDGETTVVLDPTPEQRVARGVTLLDERVPDWRTRIDTDRLDMLDGTACVVGQVQHSLDPAGWSPWQYGLDRLGLVEDSTDAHDHGFITNRDDGGSFDHWMDRDATEALRDLWIKAITGE
jgi:hypothetical protein